MKIKIKNLVINIKISFVLLAFVIIALSDVGQFFIVLALVLLHEMCHIVLANYYGAKCYEISITPIGLCAKIDLDRLSYFQKLSVLSIAPLFNIIFGILATNNISIVIGIFNLLPIYPLDGGKILGYTMGYILGTLRANRYIVAISMICSGAIIIIGLIQLTLFFGNISIFIIAMFLFSANKNQVQLLTYGFYKSIIHKSNNKILKTRVVSANKNTQLKTIIYRLGTDYYTVVCIRDRDTIEFVGEDRIQSYIVNYGINHKIGDIAN